MKANDMSLKKVFEDFYLVPAFQREYVWKERQVGALLKDFFTDSEASEIFYLGNIIVENESTGSENHFNVIDGQQRLTTCLLILCAIRDIMNVQNVRVSPELLGLISAETVDTVTLIDRLDVRVNLQYEDSQDALKDIVQGSTQKSRKQFRGKGYSESSKRIVKAYETIYEWLSNNYTSDNLKLFATSFYNRTRFIRIEAENLAGALRVFELINYRGVTLSAQDLLKNLLFMNANGEETKLDAKWKSFIEELEQVDSQPARFLRYFIMARYEGAVIRKDQVYSWFADEKNRKKCLLSKGNWAPLMETLLDTVRAHRLMLEGKSPRGADCYPLTNLELLGGASMRQHYILLMTAFDLEPEDFELLASRVEDLMFCSLIANVSPRDLEKPFAKWGLMISKINSHGELLEFLEKELDPEIRRLAPKVKENLERLDDRALPKHLKYVLAKIEAHLRQLKHGKAESLASLMDNRYQVEHISSFHSDWEKHGVSKEDVLAGSGTLGDLVLLEVTINTSIQDAPFAKKRPEYQKSEILLARSIAEDLGVGLETRQRRMARLLQQFEEWNDASIQNRCDMLMSISTEIWPFLQEVK